MWRQKIMIKSEQLNEPIAMWASINWPTYEYLHTYDCVQIIWMIKNIWNHKTGDIISTLDRNP